MKKLTKPVPVTVPAGGPAKGPADDAPSRSVGPDAPVVVEAPPSIEQPALPCQVITVFSAKGGVGKTTVATNLATVLHSATGRRVCLVDLDLAFGDVAICLRLDPVRTLIDAVGHEPGHLAAGLDHLITPYQPGFDCVLAPVAPGDAEKIPAELIAELLVALRHRYDYVVVDTAPQLSEHVLTALDHSDRHLLLTNPELPSLKSLRLTLEMFDLLKYAREARAVIVNRADDQTGLRPEEIAATVRFPIVGTIPVSRDVPVSINHGVPVAAASDHPVGRAIRRLADRVIPGVVQPGTLWTRNRGLHRNRGRS